jgi:hypothetical protein
MTNDVLLPVLLALGLLLLPAGPLGRRRHRLLTLPEFFERPRRLLGLLHFLNVFDLARAVAAVWLLRQAGEALAPALTSPWPLHLLLAGPVLLGLAAQLLFPGDADEWPAPLAFALGLFGALLPPAVAALALVLSVTVAVALRNISAGLLLLAAASAVLGRLLGAPLADLGTACLVAFLPVLAAAIGGRRLALSARRAAAGRIASVREVALPATR